MISETCPHCSTLWNIREIQNQGARRTVTLTCANAHTWSQQLLGKLRGERWVYLPVTQEVTPLHDAA